MAFIAPMLAVAGKKSLTDLLYTPSPVGFYVEPKFDGIRVIVDKDSSGTIAIYSKTGKDLSLKFPYILRDLFWTADGEIPNDTTLDGEIIVPGKYVSGVYMFDHLPICDFEALQSVVNSLPARAKAVTDTYTHQPQLHLFDALRVNGVDYTTSTLSVRKHALSVLDVENKIANDDTIHISQYAWSGPSGLHTAFASPEEIADIYDTYTAAGGEGLIVKNPDSIYHPGLRRANTWYKYKDVTTYDVIVLSCSPGAGKFKGTLGAIDFGAYDHKKGSVVYVGSCSGMTDAVRQDMWERAKLGELNGSIIEIKANGLVGSGEYKTPRHAQFLRERTDKLVEDCSVSQFKS